MPKIIGICGISGSGKTTLTQELAKKFSSTPVIWDDFDEISEQPKDYVAWYETSGDYSEWKYEKLALALESVKSGKGCMLPQGNLLDPTDIIFFDAPLGYLHKETGKYIDYVIFLDTPLDIALARRVIRDFKDKIQDSNTSQTILDDLTFYLTKSRKLFADTSGLQATSDVCIDGMQTIDELVDYVVHVLSKEGIYP